jgi:hypothetical protein
VAKAAEDVQSCRKCYWQAYKESEREYPAEIFPEGVDGYGESAQSTQSLTAMCGVVQEAMSMNRAGPARYLREVRLWSTRRIDRRHRGYIS